jgi:hypothetical protein
VTAGSSGAAGVGSAVAARPEAAVPRAGTEDDGVAGELDLEPVARGQVELLPRGRRQREPAVVVHLDGGHAWGLWSGAA